MKMEFKWAVDKVNTIGDKNLIQTVFLSCTASKEGVAETYQCVKVLQPGATFVAYRQLDEQTVLDWCFAPEITEVKDQNGVVVQTITKNLKDETEAFVSANVERQLALRESSPRLPWIVLEIPQVGA
jgi:hypothetical protein